MSEYHLHVAIKKHIDHCFIGAQNPNLKYTHIGNESRDATEAFFKKQMGTIAGWPDFIFGWPNSKTGLLEVKLPGKKLSSPQNKIISWASHIGWHTGVAWSVHDAHMVLRKWGLHASYIYQPSEEPDLRDDAQKKTDAFNWNKP